MFVSGADDDAFCTNELADVQVDVPVQPGPELLTVTDRRFRELGA